VLVLDEPTNHLDLEAIEALVEGLKTYDGTLLFVSHDRWFVGELATRILEITPTGIRDFEGGYEEYIARCGDDHLDADTVVLRAKQERKQAKERSARPADDPKRRARIKELTAKRDKTTAAIEKAENRVHEINELFCNPGFFDKTSPADVRKLENEQRQLAARRDELMAEWEQLETELEALGPVAAK
jgi:DNA repair exonuclease SbcCD ATPase subunit